MELCTGEVPVDQMDDEVAEIVRLLVVAGFHIALVTYGAGCSHSDDLQESIDVPVALSLLPDVLEKAEEDGRFRMAFADLYFKTDCGTIAFLLCEESDIHCYTQDVELFRLFSQRWAELFSAAYEADRTEPARWRPLKGGEWRSFGG